MIKLPDFGLSRLPDSKNMNIPSLIFWVVFALPLVAFLVWVMRQDKKKGVIGLIVLAILVIVAVTYMYLKTGGR